MAKLNKPCLGIIEPIKYHPQIYLGDHLDGSKKKNPGEIIKNFVCCTLDLWMSLHALRDMRESSFLLLAETYETSFDIAKKCGVGSFQVMAVFGPVL